MGFSYRDRSVWSVSFIGNATLKQGAIHSSGKTRYEHLKPSSGIVISAFYKKNKKVKKSTTTKYKDKMQKMNRKEKN